MTPINKVPIGKFCRMEWNVVYMCKNNFNNGYTLAPIYGSVPQNLGFGHKVYIYKRVKKGWAQEAKHWVERIYESQDMDNLTYIENLDILQSYESR